MTDSCLCIPAEPEEGPVDLEAPEAGSIQPDVTEGDAGEVEAGAEGEERSVEDSEDSVAAGQGVLQVQIEGRVCCKYR